MTTRLVPQQTDFDCGVAALATALRKPYDEILAALGTQARQIGVTANETVLYLWSIGHKPTYMMTKEAVQACDPYADQRVNISHEDITQLLCTTKQRAILTVRTPSGCLHAVYFDGNGVLCPKRGVMGQGYFKEYTVLEVVLLHD
ncbi:hypothetical protein HNO53_12980 [Billgrantia antri]|uniref:Peptidase C39 domain-containing protein n=1 Tax=Halomonas sulfidivorans TaxID=2733488 RepID=A0ABX7WL29_9GAMM|nr:hypothetical protein [Halomonas sulfidivorans]QTP59549.1 hypothetical protein HNO53_12980 [Halomonas sulfidivorans]